MFKAFNKLNLTSGVYSKPDGLLQFDLSVVIWHSICWVIHIPTPQPLQWKKKKKEVKDIICLFIFCMEKCLVAICSLCLSLFIKFGQMCDKTIN